MSRPINFPQNYYDNSNNPTKEILASSGIGDGIPYAPTPYGVDIPNSLLPNTFINTTTTSTTTYSPSELTSGSSPYLGILSSGNAYIDDMLVFNNYIHYDTKSPIKTFNTQTFLEQSLQTYRRYG